LSGSAGARIAEGSRSAPIRRDASLIGSLPARIEQAGFRSEDFLLRSRIHDSPHLGTRQYARILEGWIEELGLDTGAYGTHSIRRRKPTMIYRRTKNLRVVQLLLGHTKLESTVRYLGPKVDDALGAWI
jgi:site-specific recombinase XerD